MVGKVLQELAHGYIITPHSTMIGHPQVCIAKMSYGPQEYQTPNQLKVVSQWFQLKFQLPYSKFITCKILILLCFSVSRSCTYMALSVSPLWEQRGPACGHPLWPSATLVQNFSCLIIAAALIWVCKIFMRLWNAIWVFSFWVQWI